MFARSRLVGPASNRRRTTNRRWGRAAVAILAVATVVPAAGGARPDARATPVVPRAAHIVIQPQSLARGELSGVAASSAHDAWAVGSTTADRDPRDGTALIEHWDGSTWTQLPRPVGTGSDLLGVTARSASDAWAVGSVTTGNFVTKTLILHWDGHAWKRTATPAPGHGSSLRGVTALSARNAWAVGQFRTALEGKLLIEHWNGRVWKRVAKTPRLPNGFIDATLNSVTATSARDVWAVGSMTNCGCGPGLPVLLHWNGRTWKRRAISGLRGGYNLNGVDAVSARRAFVVGETGEGDSPTHAQVAQFTGRRWSRLRTPSPGPRHKLFDHLSGVAALSAHNAWAVGSTQSNILIERWNGSAWRQVLDTITLPQLAPGIAPGAHDDRLSAVAATSSRNAWAVGAVQRRLSADSLALILHWNGSAWTCCAPLKTAAATGG
jgi:hypothetical protein